MFLPTAFSRYGCQLYNEDEYQEFLDLLMDINNRLSILNPEEFAEGPESFDINEADVIKWLQVCVFFVYNNDFTWTVICIILEVLIMVIQRSVMPDPDTPTRYNVTPITTPTSFPGSCIGQVFQLKSTKWSDIIYNSNIGIQYSVFRPYLLCTIVYIVYNEMGSRSLPLQCTSCTLYLNTFPSAFLWSKTRRACAYEYDASNHLWFCQLKFEFVWLKIYVWKFSGNNFQQNKWQHTMNHCQKWITIPYYRGLAPFLIKKYFQLLNLIGIWKPFNF